jgi:hypothetical protein
MSEWVLGQNVPRINNIEFQVQLKDDSVRTVNLRPLLDHWTLWFTDCTHPLQNAICNDSQIVAWREAAHGIKENT